MDITLKQAEKLRSHLPNPDILIDAILSGKKTFSINEYEYQLVVNRYSQYMEEKKALSECANLNNKGVALEKAGKIKAAIKIYEKNIENGYPAHHSYKRLMVLYHKAKDYENEKRVIMKALEVFIDYPEYVDRLSKLKI